MKNQESDAILWASIRNGDKAAYSSLYELYVGVMYRYGLHFSSNTAEIEDSIHDVFVKIYSDYKKLPEIISIKAYLLVSFRNTLFNKLKNKEVAFKLDILDSLSAQTDGATVVEQIIEKEEETYQKQLVARLETRLSDKEREAVYFRFVENMSYKEVGKVMNIQTQSAQNFVQRAIQKMREDLPTPLLVYLLSFLI